MENKLCRGCGLTLPASAFYKHPSGLQSKCKICMRELNLTENHRINAKRCRDRNREQVRESVRKWRRLNRKANNCHSLVYYYIQRGVLVRPDNCMNCGLECKPEGHHEDYDLPLEVIWLCGRCHGLTKRISLCL